MISCEQINVGSSFGDGDGDNNNDDDKIYIYIYVCVIGINHQSMVRSD